MENRKTLSKICRQQQSSCCNNSCSMIGITIELFVRQQNFCLITFISPSLHCSAVLYRWICCIAYSLQWSSLLIPVECLNAWYLISMQYRTICSFISSRVFDIRQGMNIYEEGFATSALSMFTPEQVSSVSILSRQRRNRVPFWPNFPCPGLYHVKISHP